MPTEPNGNLLAGLAKTLQQLSGTQVSASDFDVSRLPPALCMTYRVLDAGGKTFGLSKDLGELQLKLAESSRGAVAVVAQKTHSPIERDHLTTWDFDELATNIVSRHGANEVRAFPSLVVAPSKSTETASAHI